MVLEMPKAGGPVHQLTPTVATVSVVSVARATAPATIHPVIVVAMACASALMSNFIVFSTLRISIYYTCERS